MKVVQIKKKKIFKAMAILTFILTVGVFSTVLAMQHYYKLDFSTGIVTATELNVRSGPGTQYRVVATVKRNEYIRVFAGIGDWYVVQVEGDYIGVVSKKYVKPVYPNSSSSGGSSSNSGSQTSSNMNANEKEVFELINKQRTNNGLKALNVDGELQRVARIKAQDMVDNNYFSHNSPTYGSPFQMLNSFKIPYKVAAENIAGNSTNTGAVNSWMNSSGHKANILNSNYNYTGIGVVNSKKYGRVFVQLFIGR